MGRYGGMLEYLRRSADGGGPPPKQSDRTTA